MRGEGFKQRRNRVISFVMAIAMVLTLVTVAPVTAQAAGVTNITIHFKNDWKWGTPALQYWDGTTLGTEDKWYLDSDFSTSLETKLPKQEKETYDLATLVGDFSALTFKNEDEKIDCWKVDDTNGDMVHVGNDVYAKTIHFEPLSEEASVQYKVAFNHAWNGSIGENGTSDNVTLSIPAVTSYLTVVCDRKKTNLYNSVTNGADTTGDIVSIIGTVRDSNLWEPTYAGTEYDFVKLSNRYYVYQKEFKAGSYQYKAVLNHDNDSWIGVGNILLNLLSKKVVTFVYDAEKSVLYDSVNELDKVTEALTAEPQNIEKRWALVEYD